MARTDAFRDALAGAIRGDAFTAFSNANARIGVGDSSAAFAATQTDLQAATNKLRKAMDATYPTIAANVLTYQATFATADANWVWNEWGIFNAATAGLMMNRVVANLLTKTSAVSVVMTATITMT